MGKTLTKAPETAEASTETAVEPEGETPIELVGTWEEIQERADELADKILRVTVLPERGRILRVEDLPRLPDDISAAGAFKRVSSGLKLGPSNLAARHKGVFGDIVEEKHRRRKP